MQQPAIPDNEAQRLAALRALDILDTPPEERFDRITRIAARLMDVPIALVSLVDANRQWFKSCIGLDASETPRGISFCGHAILESEALVIADALADPRFADNPLVAGEPRIRFYVGQPLAAVDGSRLGTLCLIDRKPRQMSASDFQALRDLAHLVERELNDAQLGQALQAREQGENRLRETTRLHRAILDSANYTIISTDVDGTIRTFNAAAESMLGYRADEMVGKTSPAIFHDRNEVVRRAGELSQELCREIAPGFEVFVTKARLGVPDENEWTYVRKDGGRVPVLLSVTALRDERGEITGFLGVGNDISERRYAEESLRESEARYRLMAEHSSDIIARLSAQGIFNYVSPASGVLLGYEPDELVGHRLYDLVHPDDREMVRQAFESVAGNFLLDTITYRVPTKEGNCLRLETSLRGLREHGEIAAQQVIAVSRDVTERMLAQESLSRFSNVLDNTLDMIFMFEPDTLRFVYLNRGAVESMGYTREELLQMTPFQIKPLIAEPAFRALIAPLLSGEKQALNFETVHRRRDGTDFPVEIFLQLVREKGGKGLFVAIVRDITERQKVDRLKNEFVSTVSHELRTPLTSIRGSLGLIAGGVAGELPAQAKSMIDIAYKNSERLISLINDILDVEKIESGKISFDLQQQPLMPIIEQALEGNRAYGEQFGVTFQLVATLPEVQVNVDRGRLLQVMSNLLSNAAKFSPHGGQVDVSFTQEDAAVRVAVSDRGPGIPEEFYARIFHKFSQADASDTRQQGGTGLGLSITKTLVEKMGGHIGFDSEIGVGATFYFVLPAWSAV